MYTEELYILWCTRQKWNAAVCDCGKTWNSAEHDHRTLLDWRSRCRNVRIALRFALDLRPNIAGIGTLHLLLTLNSDLWSDVM